MGDTLQKPNGSVEVSRLDRLPERAKEAVRKLDLAPLDEAKASVGLAVKHAIGDDPLKVYGDEGQMSKVIAGEKVPDYMARIYRNPQARRRYALSLLRSDPNVRIRTTVDWDEEKAG
jgi:hypothetical protein